MHLCIFAYGQTGAGKTHTIAGATAHDGSAVPAEQQGIQDLAIGELLRFADARTQESKGAISYEMWISALEIYNESLQDLLLEAPAGGQGLTSPLDIRQSREGLGGCLSGSVNLSGIGGIGGVADLSTQAATSVEVT
jgi:hypothetical protein